MNFSILNSQSFVDDINICKQTKQDCKDKLCFLVRHELADLVHTGLYQDLLNIIMNYVNDEVIVQYHIVHSMTNCLTIYYTLSCSIWLEEYKFCYADYVPEYVYLWRSSVYLSTDNNIIQSYYGTSLNSMDMAYHLYYTASTQALHMFLNKGDLVGYEIHNAKKLEHMITIINLIHNAVGFKQLYPLCSKN